LLGVDISVISQKYIPSYQDVICLQYLLDINSLNHG